MLGDTNAECKRREGRIVKHLYQYKFPIGSLWLAEENGTLTYVGFDEQDQRIRGYQYGNTPFLKEVAHQLEEYFAGQRKRFQLPLAPQGTDFQQKVWRELQAIPYGETRSYKEVARRIGNPKACRAVGLANNRNPISIIIPCHRVIGHRGQLVGYGGGLEIKRFLLELERKYV